MKKRIAILGANEAVSVLIQKAKQLGYETHVFAWKCGDPGEKIADYFYPISIEHKDLILAKCKEIGVCGVCSITSDFAAPVVGYVARHLGLPANPERTDIVARNKYEMRKAFKECGEIYSPNFMVVTSSNELGALQNFTFPLIVKPTDRWSSKGISRVDNADELKKAVDIAVSESLEKRAIIEEFMDGPEYSAECIVFKGKPTILAFTQKKTTGYPHYIETGHIQPSDIPINKQNEIKRIIKKALKALDITNSAAHVEFRILENGKIGFMEIGARMGGDCIGTDLTPTSTGMDYVKMVIDVACGKEPTFEQVDEPRPIEIRFIISQEDIDFMNSLPGEKIIRKNISDLDFSKKVIDSSTRHGYFIFNC